MGDPFEPDFGKLMTPPPDQRHVVLAKPGDVLLLGNVGEVTEEMVDVCRTFFDEAGIRVAVFPEDIDVGGLEEHEVLTLLDDREARA